MSFMEDPFEAAPADEAQAVEAPQSPVQAPAAVTATTVNTAPSEGKVTITLKGGISYDAPWIVIHAADAADAKAQLDDPVLGELINRVKAVAPFFSGTPAAAPQAAPAASAPPAGATAPSNGETRSCKHGAMQYKSGVSAKNGKTWQAFMCPTPKGAPDQCDAQWIR